MQTWLGRAGDELSKRGRVLLERPAGRRAVMLLGRVAGGFFLSRSVVFGSYAPFGVAWTAASGSGSEGLAALIGAAAGYMTAGGQIDALRYIAILALSYAAAFVFRGVALGENPFFLPGVAAGLTALIGVVFLADDGFPLQQILLSTTEVLLILTAGYFYRLVTRPEQSGEGIRRAIGVLVLSATLFLSLTDIVFFDVFHPARVAAGVFVLLAAHRSGAGLGSAAGLSAGTAMDMALGYPFFSMSYGLSGLLAGVFKKAGKLTTALVYVAAGAITALWAGTEMLRLSALLETFAASVLFLAAPVLRGTRALEEVGMEQTEGKRLQSGRRAQEYARRKLQQCALAFRDLHDTLSSAFEKPQNDSDVGRLFDRAADAVCRKCALRGLCWDRDAGSTYQALSDASGPLARNGRVAASDFPPHFANRCVQFPKFLEVANEEMTALLLRRQYNSRLRESRRQLCRQYAEMSRIMDNMAEQVGRETTFDEGAERRLVRALSAAGSLEATVTRAGDGRRTVELEGTGIPALLEGDREALVRNVSLGVGYRVSQPEQVCAPGGGRLIFGQAETLSATVGVACHKKQGQSVSGDSGSWFKTADGRLWLILSDGMGTGPEAGAQSAEAVRLLEKFLRAGVDPSTALATLHSALVLRGEEGKEGFVTVDLCVCDLLTGQTRFYKSGASPSYIKRGRRVSRVSGQGWPVGLGLNGGGPAVTNLRLESGDVAVMMSDGVCEMGDDPWLTRLLETHEEASPKELAGTLLEQAVLQNGRCDDMMVQVLCLR